ncbi:MAG: hypothetical protein JOZ51_00150 [Chloroflexi bacterium]|nr:hypothetical protein [Chloroflexota bacterium]
MSASPQPDESAQAPLRPADLAHLLLAGGDLLPRQRARDQQADLAGMELKRRVLHQLIALDPEPENLDAALDQIIAEIGPPFGPTRGICLNVRYDWEAACSSPQFIAWLIDEAVREGQGQRRGKKRAPQSNQ